MTEFEFITWLRRQTSPDPRVLVGPGDDCAVLSEVHGQLLATTDMLMDGVDFHLAEVGPRRVGRKAMAVNLSDIAAMAGRPLGALVAVAFPKGLAPSVTEELYLGMKAVAEEFETAIVGGDTNAWDGPLVISVTLLGEATSRGPVQRSGAKPGDWLMVTGPLGGSIRGKHLDFIPRVREALALHEYAKLHAMIDISDGLAADVGHLRDGSGCGVVLRASAIPISNAARQMNDGKSALEHALGDGEDFELAFAVSAEDAKRLLASKPIAGLTLSHIGEFIEGARMLLEVEGERRPLEPAGYVHKF